MSWREAARSRHTSRKGLSGKQHSNDSSIGCASTSSCAVRVRRLNGTGHGSLPAASTTGSSASGLAARGILALTGRFAAMMDVELVNDGPVTIILDSRDRGGAESVAGA